MERESVSPSDRPALNSISQLELSVAPVDGLAALNAAPR